VSASALKARRSSPRPVRLLFLNRSFWPDLEATGQNLTELCEDLSKRFEITFIAGPSYHVATAQRGLWTSERLGDITIIRTWGTRFPKRRLIARLMNLGSYFVLAAFAALSTSKPDIVIAATDPPLLGAWASCSANGGDVPLCTTSETYIPMWRKPMAE
jgi:colanic acid biosynthesis glycosyl transferase WcaI